jgi:hypothetical protein
MSALLSFLGGSAFRMVWGEVSHFFTARQEHKYELERLEQQGRLDAATHERNLKAMSLQHELGIKEIYVQQEAATAAGELDAWVTVVKSTTTKTGVAWVDAWNQSIRPGVATIAVVAMLIEIALLGRLTEWHHEVFGAALGLFLADRALAKRGK